MLKNKLLLVVVALGILAYISLIMVDFSLNQKITELKGSIPPFAIVSPVPTGAVATPEATLVPSPVTKHVVPVVNKILPSATFPVK